MQTLQIFCCSETRCRGSNYFITGTSSQLYKRRFFDLNFYKIKQFSWSFFLPKMANSQRNRPIINADDAYNELFADSDSDYQETDESDSESQYGF